MDRPIMFGYVDDVRPGAGFGLSSAPGETEALDFIQGNFSQIQGNINADDFRPIPGVNSRPAIVSVTGLLRRGFELVRFGGQRIEQATGAASAAEQGQNPYPGPVAGTVRVVPTPWDRELIR